MGTLLIGRPFGDKTDLVLIVTGCCKSIIFRSRFNFVNVLPLAKFRPLTKICHIHCTLFSKCEHSIVAINYIHTSSRHSPNGLWATPITKRKEILNRTRITRQYFKCKKKKKTHGNEYEATIHDCNKILNKQSERAITGHKTDRLLRHSTT